MVAASLTSVDIRRMRSLKLDRHISRVV